MKGSVFQAAGTALLWKAAQLVGVKVVFMLRLLILARLLTPRRLWAGGDCRDGDRLFAPREDWA